jgi:2-C-methyl-D-erythritol 4-phosphate cytidylyltransferase
MSSSVWAIVVAGGSGSRFGGPIPKQYSTLGDRRVIDWSLEAMRSAAPAGVVLVVPADRVHHSEPGASVVVAGGDTRSQSVRNGLAAIPASARIVLVHDAARPLVPPSVIDALLEAIDAGAEAAIPGLPIADTVKRVVNGFVVATLPRDELIAVQTPQAFRADALRHAHDSGSSATDDAALVEAAGGRVAVVPGAEQLRKVTASSDLEVLERFIATGAHTLFPLVPIPSERSSSLSESEGDQ